MLRDRLDRDGALGDLQSGLDLGCLASGALGDLGGCHAVEGQLLPCGARSALLSASRWSFSMICCTMRSAVFSSAVTIRAGSMTPASRAARVRRWPARTKRCRPRRGGTARASGRPLRGCCRRTPSSGTSCPRYDVGLDDDGGGVQHHELVRDGGGRGVSHCSLLLRPTLFFALLGEERTAGAEPGMHKRGTGRRGRISGDVRELATASEIVRRRAAPTGARVAWRVERWQDRTARQVKTLLMRTAAVPAPLREHGRCAGSTPGAPSKGPEVPCLIGSCRRHLVGLESRGKSDKYCARYRMGSTQRKVRRASSGWCLPAGVVIYLLGLFGELIQGFHIPTTGRNILEQVLRLYGRTWGYQSFCTRFSRWCSNTRGLTCFSASQRSSWPHSARGGRSPTTSTRARFSLGTTHSMRSPPLLSPLSA